MTECGEAYPIGRKGRTEATTCVRPQGHDGSHRDKYRAGWPNSNSKPWTHRGSKPPRDVSP